MTEMNIEEMRKAHKFINENKRYLNEKQDCVCIYCLKRFISEEIDEYTADDTALCPYCWIDGVIGEKSGYTFSDDELGNMHEFFFNTNTEGISEHIKDLDLINRYNNLT